MPCKTKTPKSTKTPEIPDIPKCLEEKTVHEGKILSFRELTMEFPSGNTAKWDLVRHHGAAAVVAVDSDGKLFMVKQYRPGCDRVTIEIPAGCINPGETRKDAAARELEEEIGYKANDISLLLKYYSAAAYSDEYIEIYLARDLVKTRQHLDEDEDLTVCKYDLNTLVKMILDCEIQDSKTIAAVLAYKAKLENMNN
ncbi:MAG: NUDIX hydrolase [Lachnospiraceae bacterium]|nr:NUDIX hydrolase [Lachnospiraceae bacterium]